MKRISSVQGTTAIKFSPDEVSPETAVLARDLVAFIGGKYKFSGMPQPPPGLLNDPVFVFQSGELIFNDRKLPIHQLTMPTGAAVVTAKDTDTADIITNDIVSSLEEKFGYTISASIKAKYYMSVIVVEFAFSIEHQLRSLAHIKKLLDQEIPRINHPFDIKRLAFGSADRLMAQSAIQSIDEIPNVDFLIERRAGEPHSSNRFVCSGPLTTSELERVAGLVEQVMRD